jgi:hypothetical protein
MAQNPNAPTPGRDPCTIRQSRPRTIRLLSRCMIHQVIPPMSRRSHAGTQLQIRQVICRVNCRGA